MSFVGDMLFGADVPPTPDPAVVAGAQGQMNEATARLQASLNRPNQYTPYGNMIWTQNSPDHWSSRVQLSPQMQRLFNENMAVSLGLGGATRESLADVNQAIRKNPPIYDNQYRNKMEQAYYDRETSRLDPRFQESQRALESSLINQGINRGTNAWATAADEFGRTKNDAYSQAMQNAIIQGRGEAEQDSNLKWKQRSNLLNELNALRTGQQVQQPQFNQNTNATQVATTPYAQSVYNSYQGDLAGYNAGVSQGNSLMGGLATLGAGYFMGGK
jgi:hypothetical protein